MDVNGVPGRGLDERRGDAVAIRGPHEELRPQREDGLERSAAQTRRLEDGDADRARPLFHRRLAERAAMGRAIGLRDDADERERAGVGQALHRVERRDGEGRRAEKEGARLQAETEASSSGSTGWRSSRDFRRST